MSETHDQSTRAIDGATAATDDQVLMAAHLLILLKRAEETFKTLGKTLFAIDCRKFTPQVTGNDIVCDLNVVTGRLPIEIRALAEHLLGRREEPRPDDRMPDEPPYWRTGP